MDHSEKYFKHDWQGRAAKTDQLRYTGALRMREDIDLPRPCRPSNRIASLNSLVSSCNGHTMKRSQKHQPLIPQAHFRSAPAQDLSNTQKKLIRCWHSCFIWQPNPSCTCPPLYTSLEVDSIPHLEGLPTLSLVPGKLPSPPHDYIVPRRTTVDDGFLGVARAGLEKVRPHSMTAAGRTLCRFSYLRSAKSRVATRAKRRCKVDRQSHLRLKHEGGSFSVEIGPQGGEAYGSRVRWVRS